MAERIDAEWLSIIEHEHIDAECLSVIEQEHTDAERSSMDTAMNRHVHI